MAVLSLSNLKKTWYYLQKNGVKSAYLAAMERLYESRQEPYVFKPLSEETLQKQRDFRVSDVRFSIVVPAFETKEAHLTALLDSLYAQTYPVWELVIADASADDRVEKLLKQWGEAHCVAVQREDAEAKEAGEWHSRLIRYLKLKKNAGIADNTNEGIVRAAGEYIGLLDHDDLLTPDALFEMARAIEEERNAEGQPGVLYSDEDKCDGEAVSFYEPHRKMDFNLDLLLSNNYICHFLMMESGLLKSLKLRSGFDGAQDYDLVLRAAECRARFVHVPRVLYHWRCHNDSTAANPRSKAYAYEAGKRAVADFCARRGWKAEVSSLKHLGFYRVDYEGSVFAQRPEVGAVAGPLPGKRKLCSGIYEEDKSMRYAGLKKGFSGPMHRAALQQDVEFADLRCMRVCDSFMSLYEKAVEKLAEAPEEEVRRASMAFCAGLRQKGYLILWDPKE